MKVKLDPIYVRCQTCGCGIELANKEIEKHFVKSINCMGCGESFIVDVETTVKVIVRKEANLYIEEALRIEESERKEAMEELVLETSLRCREIEPMNTTLEMLKKVRDISGYRENKLLKLYTHFTECEDCKKIYYFTCEKEVPRIAMSACDSCKIFLLVKPIEELC